MDGRRERRWTDGSALPGALCRLEADVSRRGGVAGASVAARDLTRTHTTRRWDEWVPESRLLKFNDDNLAKQKALIEARKAAASANASAAAAAASASGATSGRKSARDVSETADSSRKGKEARGTKRGRDTVETEEEYVKRPEIRINIPDSLKVRLVDDWENVTKKSQVSCSASRV